LSRVNKHRGREIRNGSDQRKRYRTTDNRPVPKKRQPRPYRSGDRGEIGDESSGCQPTAEQARIARPCSAEKGRKSCCCMVAQRFISRLSQPLSALVGEPVNDRLSTDALFLEISFFNKFRQSLVHALPSELNPFGNFRCSDNRVRVQSYSAKYILIRHFSIPGHYTHFLFPRGKYSPFYYGFYVVTRLLVTRYKYPDTNTVRYASQAEFRRPRKRRRPRCSEADACGAVGELR